MLKAAPKVGTTNLSLLNNWLAAADAHPYFSLSPHLRGCSPSVVLSPPSTSHLCDFFPPAFRHSTFLRVMNCESCRYIKGACATEEILKAFDAKHPGRGSASFSMFASSGQFLTPQLLLFGNAGREWLERENGSTGCRRLKCYMFAMFSV